MFVYVHVYVIASSAKLKKNPNATTRAAAVILGLNIQHRYTIRQLCKFSGVHFYNFHSNHSTRHRTRYYYNRLFDTHSLTQSSAHLMNCAASLARSQCDIQHRRTSITCGSNGNNVHYTTRIYFFRNFARQQTKARATRGFRVSISFEHAHAHQPICE